MADHVFYVAATRLSSPIPRGCVCCGADALLAANINGEARHLCAACGVRELDALVNEAPPLSTDRRAEFERASAEVSRG